MKTNKCPLDGDTKNKCAGCVYSGDYYFDEKKGECVERETKYKCKKCGCNKFRASLDSNVDVILDETGNIEDVGFDASDPEIDKLSTYCEECGEAVTPA